MRQDALHRPTPLHPRARTASRHATALSHATGIADQTLAEWADAGLIAGDDGSIEMRDATRVRSLCDSVGLPGAMLRRTLDQLRAAMSDAPLGDVTLVARDGALLVRLDDGALADATRQFRFDFDGDMPATLGRIGPPPASTPVDWHERGIAMEIDGDVAGAIGSYGRALLARGPDAQVAFDLAHALAEAGHAERAIERYRQAIELDPTRADAWLNLGDLLATAGDTSAAIDAFRHALDLEPDDAASHYALADTLDAHGDVAAARLHFAAFLRLADGPDEQVAFARSRAADADGRS